MAFWVWLALSLALAGTAHSQTGQPTAPPDTVTVRSGAFTLRGLLWRPPGQGPFPAVLFTHGSGRSSDAASGHPRERDAEVVGPMFARHGYVCLFLFRKGEGLSTDQGTPGLDIMDRAMAKNGLKGRNRVQMELLRAELEDVRAGLSFLRSDPQLDPHRIALVGHSFGGSLTLLLAENDVMVDAVVLFSVAGFSWERSPQLRARLLSAVQQVKAPVMFIYARNDYSTAAGEKLGAEMTKRAKPHLVKIYPAVGATPEDGHRFVYLGVERWEKDVFAFLDGSGRP